ncbi:MAG: hypothetical protein ACTHMV_13525 [Chitinophagaceae bacterium]
MAYQLKERPHRHAFSLNPIRYVVEVNNPEAPGCAVEFQLYVFPIEEAPVTDVSSFGFNGKLVTTQTLYPNPDGRIEFYLEDFLNSQLDWQLPALFLEAGPSSISAVTSQIKRYSIRYRQITKTNLSPAWASDFDNLRLVLKGGVAKEKFDRNNYFINHLYVKKGFLTWQPDDELIGISEVRCLTYFHHDVELPELRARIRIVYTDGTDFVDFKDFPLAPQSLLFHIPCSLKDFAVDDSKHVWFYEVSVVDPDEVEFAKVYRLFVDYNQYYQQFSFIYSNSLGGIDTVRIRGDYDVEMVRDYADIEKATGGDFSGSILPTEIGAINISKYEIYKGDAGYLNSKAMQESLQDMLLSENVFRILGGRGLRIVNLQKSQPMGSSDDTRWSFPLQWRYTYNNSSFTPFETSFGNGVNDEPDGPILGICQAPGNLTVEKVAEEDGEATYAFTWDEILGAAGYELQYKLSSTDNWTTVPTEDPNASLTLSIEGEYQWRIRTKCSEEDFSGYVSGQGFTVDFVEAACMPHSNLAVSLITLTETDGTVTFTWAGSPGTVGFILEWRPVGTAVWNAISSILNLQITVPKDVQYEWRLRAKCDNAGNYSQWVYGPNFIPSSLSGTCNAPTNLQVTVTNGPVFMKQINFSWNAAIGALDYQLLYRQVGASSWITRQPSGTTETGLWLSGKEMEWKMRSNCIGGGFSAFVNGPNFFT